jgi:hypothetical protein
MKLLYARSGALAATTFMFMLGSDFKKWYRIPRV